VIAILLEEGAVGGMNGIEDAAGRTHRLHIGHPRHSVLGEVVAGEGLLLEHGVHRWLLGFA
jgi:hypothetical protein